MASTGGWWSNCSVDAPASFMDEVTFFGYQVPSNAIDRYNCFDMSGPGSVWGPQAVRVYYPFAFEQRIPSPLEFAVVASNMFMILPIYMLIKYRFHLSAMLLILTGVVSYFYHTCRSYGLCIFRPEIIRTWDHLFATSAMQIIFICFATLVSFVQSRANAFFIFGSFLLNGFFISLRPSLDDESPWQNVANIIYGVLVMYLSWRIARDKMGQWREALRYVHVKEFCTGLALGLCAFGCYFVEALWPDSEDIYNITHALWHTLVSIALFIALRSARKAVAWMHEKNPSVFEEAFVVASRIITAGKR
jgi:hypothetical protein